MSNYQSNPGFVGDDSVAKNDKNPGMFTVELNDAHKDKNEKDYDPFEHRDVEHPTTNAETLLHLLKGSLGTGILAMPLAFLNSGYILGIIGTFVIGMLCLYCIHLLINAEHELCRRNKVPSLSYPATAQAAMAEGPPILKKFAEAAPHIVNTFLLIYQLGTCCVYVVFISKNIKAVMDEHIVDIDVRLYMLMLLLPLIFINWIRNLKYLAPFSTMANAITVVSFGIILYYLFHEGISFEDRVAVGEVHNLPLFFGTVLFALEAIGIIMPLENEMKTPKAFGRPCGVLNIGMVTIVFLYIFMGLLGYLAYGKTVEDTITLNLQHNEILAQVVQIALALAIFITHALQCYVAVDITWNDYLSKKFDEKSRPIIYEFFIRTLLVLVTFLLAVAIPNLGAFISLFGALCLSALGLAFPALIDIGTNYYNYTGMKFQFLMTKNILLIIFAIFGLIVGTYTSISEIIKGFS